MVDPAHQRKGIGAKLLATVLEKKRCRKSADISRSSHQQLALSPLIERRLKGYWHQRIFADLDSHHG